jgi:hypothetical protein
MDSKEIIWFDIEKAIFDQDKYNEKLYFSDEPIIGLQLTKIYYYSEKRNAYHGTESSLYYGKNAFHYDIDVIKSNIERNRKKGSYFTIYEIPALALKGRYRTIVFLDNAVNSIKPYEQFASLEKLEFDLSSINEIYKWIKENISTEYIGFVMPTLHLTGFQTPLLKYNSMTNGPYTLSYYRSSQTNQYILSQRFNFDYFFKVFLLFDNYLSSKLSHNVL